MTTLATHTLSFEEAEPTIVTLEHTKSIEDSIQSDSKETELLTIDMQITEVVSRLSMAVKEEEKKELDQQFQELLQKKKRLI
ncbi:hypothetical protein [Alkalicoccobacillus plakortidis]|uniref:Uncharacterized protein n=1 Tax=Alkalicoccobacillus plakortidis TaxID=444060 RepID=A0ABT0XK04_9BACI|nr:hypothetical protein [Alkalicoccobacillus plakortidis]MCM2676224.1 hypothetical protein [Alkalicoccobacillus plakortidis]